MARRPLRNLQEGLTERIPEGPLGAVGRGNLFGAVSFAGVEVAGAFVPGGELDPGFNVVSQTVEHKDGVDKHIFDIDAYSKDVARFVGKFRSAPSNLDFLLRDIEVVKVEPKKKRSTVTTWRVVTEVKESPATEKIEGRDD